ncbi:MAG: sulfite exporter TauE/SafE family protein [Hyphomicrobiaceae bacterium]
MDILPIAYAVLVVLGAAVVRGYSGFGFSLLTISALSLMFSPVEVIASIFLLEIAASLHLLPGIWRDVQWRSVGLLLIGTAIATPIGVSLLKQVPEAPMRVALAAFVLVAVALLWRGFALKRVPSSPATLATGALGGLFNGAFGIGGPPIILFYFSSPAGDIAGRASLIALFLGMDLIGLATQTWNGLITLDHVWRAALFLPVLLIGISLGARSFKGSDPAVFRRRVLILIAVIALLIGLQGARSMLGF